MTKKKVFRFIAFITISLGIGFTVVACGKSDGFGIGGKVIITGGSQ